MTTSKLSRSAVPGVWCVYAATAAMAACLSTAAVPAQAEIIVRGIEGKPLQEARPAPAFLKPDVNIIVAQPAPSDVNPSFLGPVLLMRQAHVDLEKGTATLPLRKGKLRSGEVVWFVLTDTTDADLANLHGLVYAPKMAYGLTGKGSREATIERDGTFTFEAGKVDFSPDRSVTSGAAPNFFPPKAYKPGSVGDAGCGPVSGADALRAGGRQFASPGDWHRDHGGDGQVGGGIAGGGDAAGASGG